MDLTAEIQEGQAGLQTQLHALRIDLSRIDAERKSQHSENLLRLVELEKVLIKGNGEISLVRKVDRVQSSLDDMKAGVASLSDAAATVNLWRGRLIERESQESKKRWKIGDVAVPILVAVLAAALTAIAGHFIR